MMSRDTVYCIADGETVQRCLSCPFLQTRHAATLHTHANWLGFYMIRPVHKLPIAVDQLCSASISNRSTLTEGCSLSS
jgi:hypothetical protein